MASHDVFESWIAVALPRFTSAGLPEPAARELIVSLICALEGAFILARAARSTEALDVAGQLVAGATERALLDATPGGIAGQNVTADEQNTGDHRVDPGG